MASAQDVELQTRERFDWYAEQVKLKCGDDELYEPENPTPVFPALDYTKVSPPLNTFNDHDFFNRPTDILEAISLSLHIFFSLPARGLDTSGLKKRARSQTDQYTLNKTSNKESAAHKLFHRVVMSDAGQMNFDETYRKMNDLVKGADNRIRLSFWATAHLSAPIKADLVRGDLPENATKGSFAAILNPIINLFGELWGNLPDFDMGSTSYDYKNQVDEKDKTEYTAIPDFALKENGEPFVCIKVFPSINIDDAHAFSDVFTQVVSQCICSGTPYGAFTDYLSTVCLKLELEEEDIKDVKKFTYGTDVESDDSMFKHVKVSYVRVKHDAPVNTLASVLAAHIFNAREDMLLRRDEYRVLLLKLGAALQPTSEEIKIRNRKSYNGFLNYLDSTRAIDEKEVNVTVNKVTKTVNLYDTIPFDKSIRIIQAGESYNSQVLEINEDVFKRLTGDGEHSDDHPPASRYLLKFFDPVRGKRVHKDFTFTETKYREIIKHTFFLEFAMYDKLASLWGQCIPRLYHAGICHLSDSDGHDIKFGGLLLIVELIEGTPPDFSRLVIQQSARDALKAMHDLGAVHGDISSRNMIQRGDQVFLLDFGLSICKETEKGYNNHTDFEDLQRRDREALENTIEKYPTDHSTSTIPSSL